MNETANAVTNTVKKGVNKLSQYKLKQTYDISFSLVDENDPNPSENTHVIKGSVECKLLKMLAVIGVIAVGIAAIKFLCSLFLDD